MFGVGLGALLASRRIRVARVLVLGCAFAVALLAVSGPYLVALRQISGSWTLTEKKSAVAVLRVDRLPIPPSISPEPPTGISRPQPTSQRERPAWVPETGAMREALGEVLTDGMRALKPGFLVLVLLGARLRLPSAHTLYVLAYTGLFFLVLFGLHLEAGYVSKRHWLVVAAMLLPYAGRGLVGGVQAVGKRWGDERFLDRLAWGAVGIVVVGLALTAILSREDPAKLARKEAALWLRRSGPVQVLSAHRSRIAYYAGADRWVQVPTVQDPAMFVRELRTLGADFLVADQTLVPEELWEGAEGLRLVHQVSDPPSAVLVFRLEGAPVAQVGTGP